MLIDFHNFLVDRLNSKFLTEQLSVHHTSNALLHYLMNFSCEKNSNNLKCVLWLTIHHKVVQQRELGVVGPLTVTLLQMYC